MGGGSPWRKKHSCPGGISLPHRSRTLRACLFAWTRVAHAYQPSLTRWRQPQVMQLGQFVCLAQAGAGLGWDSVCLLGQKCMSTLHHKTGSLTPTAPPHTFFFLPPLLSSSHCGRREVGCCTEVEGAMWRWRGLSHRRGSRRGCSWRWRGGGPPRRGWATALVQARRTGHGERQRGLDLRAPARSRSMARPTRSSSSSSRRLRCSPRWCLVSAWCRGHGLAETLAVLARRVQCSTPCQSWRMSWVLGRE